MYDRGTNDLEVYPAATKSEDDTVEAFQHWAGPKDKVDSFYADNAPELKAAAKRVGWRMPTATPGVPRTNGLIERMVRNCKTMAKANRSQAGFHKSWWPYTMRHLTFSRRIKMVDGDSIYNKHHETGHCKAKRIPCGAFVDYLPTPSPQETKRSKELGDRTRKGLFVG